MKATGPVLDAVLPHKLYTSIVYTCVGAECLLKN